MLFPLLVSFLLLFSAGCGGSGGGFAPVTPSSGPGTLVFQFVKPVNAQAIQVPAETTLLRFDFFNASGANVLSTERPFNFEVTVTGVPSEATRVEITTYGPGRVPLTVISSPVTVTPNASTTVFLGGAQVTTVQLQSLIVDAVGVAAGATQQVSVSGQFDNGDVVVFNETTGGTATFGTTVDTNIATISSTGLVTGNSGGTTTAPVSFTINGQTVDGTVSVTVNGPAGQLIVEPETLVFAPGGILGAVDDLINLLATPNQDQIDHIGFFKAYFVDPETNQRIEVTSNVGVSFTNFSDPNLDPSGFAYLNVVGEGIALAFNPPGPVPARGDTATMVVSYNHNGVRFTDNVQVVFDFPTLTSVEFLSAPDGTLTLPADGVTGFPLAAVVKYSNGFSLPLFDLAGGTSAFNNAQFTLTGLPTGATLAGPAVAIAGGSAGTSTLSVSVVSDIITTPTVVGSVDLELISTTGVNEVALDVIPSVIDPLGHYTVTVTYDGGVTEDITGSWRDSFVGGAIQSTTGPGAVGFGGLIPATGRILGAARGNCDITIGDAATASNTLNNLGLPGADTDPANNTVSVNVFSAVSLSILASLPIFF